MTNEEVEALARTIIRQKSGKALPDWLLQLLPIRASSLACLIRGEKAYPGRPEQRKRLKAIEKAAQLIQSEMVDTNILQLLVPSDADHILNENETFAGLIDIQQRARDAHCRIPAGRGPAKHYPVEERFPNKTVCALAIAVIWEQVHGKWPGKANQEAQEACNSLWVAAGGVPPRGIEGWLDPLQAAGKHRNSVHAKILRVGPKKKTEPRIDRLAALYGGK